MIIHGAKAFAPDAAQKIAIVEMILALPMAIAELRFGCYVNEAKMINKLTQI